MTYNLGCDVAHPPLPDVPVGLINGAGVTTERTSVVGNFASGKRLSVHWVFVALRELGAVQAVVAVVVLDAREETVSEVISVTDVT